MNATGTFPQEPERWVVDREGPTIIWSDGTTTRPLWGPGSEPVPPEEVA